MARTTIRTEDITASEVTTAKMATDPTNASNLSSGSVPAAQLGNVDLTGLEDDIALLGFRVASNGSLAKYNLVDQTVDDFQDTSGVDASSSTNEIRDSSGKYYSGEVSASTTAFTTDGTWTVPGGVTTVGVLVIAGGGGGGYTDGGGRGSAGGAGGLINIAADTWDVTGSATYAITIGDGGVIQTPGGTGGNTTVVGDTKTLTALGGGGGGQGDMTDNATDGGSGGANWYNGYPGAASTQPVNTSDGVNTYNTTGKGNAGGTSGAVGPYAAGGGGAGGVGGNFDDAAGPLGGAGLDLTSQWGTTYGVSGVFAGGGSGSNYNANSSYAATGGGGIGNNTANNSGGNTATANTGGGGGSGGDGGSGLVLIGVSASYNNMTLISTTTAAQAAPTKGDVVFTYTDSIGTATLGTDLTAEISADGGSTWTAMTLGSEGSTGTHKIATAHNVTISSTITSPWNMAYRIKTLNQSGSKATRIQAVSLGWS